MILPERDWSWTVVSILYILAAYFVRSWFLNPLTSRSKLLDRKVNYEIKLAYLKNSILGWVFFFLPIVLLMILWRKEILPVKIKDVFLIAGAAGSFAFSVLLHLIAFGIAAISVLKQVSEKAKENNLEL